MPKCAHDFIIRATSTAEDGFLVIDFMGGCSKCGAPLLFWGNNPAEIEPEPMLSVIATPLDLANHLAIEGPKRPVLRIVK